MNNFGFIIFGSFLGVMMSIAIICLFESYNEKKKEVKRTRNLDYIKKNIEEYLKKESNHDRK